MLSQFDLGLALHIYRIMPDRARRMFYQIGLSLQRPESVDLAIASERYLCLKDNESNQIFLWVSDDIQDYEYRDVQEALRCRLQGINYSVICDAESASILSPLYKTFTINNLVFTRSSYGRDYSVLKDHFYVRLAGLRDIEMLANWLAGEEKLQTLEEINVKLQELISKKELWTLTLKKKPVSMLQVRHVTNTIMTISGVYTPSVNRNHGYASSLLSWILRYGIEEKYSVVLDADWDDQDTNRLYRSLGFQPLGVLIRFSR